MPKMCELYSIADCIVFAAVTAVLLVNASAAQALQYQQSEACHGSDSCSLHELSCDTGHHLAILENYYGFQPQDVYTQCKADAANGSCPQHCCGYNVTTDCKQEFSARDLDRVQRECSHKQACQVRGQKGDNTACTNATLSSTSTYSVVRAMCVPESATTDPCTDTTVTGHIVSLYHSQSPAHSCRCRLDTSTTNSNNQPKVNYSSLSHVDITAYDVQAPSSTAWWVRVRDSGGREVLGYTGTLTQFPAASPASSVSSLPVMVSVSFPDDGGSTLQRVWLGFRAESQPPSSLPLILRCGQDALDYESALSSQNTVLRTTTLRFATTAVSDPKKDTTDIIVYAAIGVSALIALAFAYVCLKKIRKKGCPSWCPPPCRGLECGKDVNDTTITEASEQNRRPSNSNSNATNRSSSKDNNTGSETNADEIRTVSEGVGVIHNGSVRLSAFIQRDYRKHRWSSNSLRHSSFGTLENITETEEESQFPTHHTHSTIDLEEAYKMIDRKLSCLRTEEDDADDVNDHGSFSTIQGVVLVSQSSEHSGVTLRSEIESDVQSVSDPGEGRGSLSEERGLESGDGEEVVFCLGTDNESSDPDLGQRLS